MVKKRKKNNTKKRTGKRADVENLVGEAKREGLEPKQSNQNIKNQLQDPFIQNQRS